jgi:hypothetical protein
MSEEPSNSVIGPRTAAVLFALLAIAAGTLLSGTPRYFALLIVLALAVKSYVHYLRSRVE